MELTTDYNQNNNLWKYICIIFMYFFLLLAAFAFSSCSVNKHITKDKQETKTETEVKKETKSVENNTVQIAETRTIVEEVKDSVWTKPIQNIFDEDVKDNDTISQVTEDLIFKQYKKNGKIVTDVKVKSKLILVDKKKTTIENINTSKQAEIKTENKELSKSSTETKSLQISKDIKREGINWNYLWWLLLLLIIPVWKYFK